MSITYSSLPCVNKFKLPTSGPTTSKAVHRLASTTQSPTDPTTVRSETDSGASDAPPATPSTTPDPTLVPTTPPPSAATTAPLPPMLNQATTVTSKPTSTTPQAGRHTTETGHAAEDENLIKNSTGLEEGVRTGSQNHSLQAVGIEEEATDASPEETVLDGSRTTPMTSVMELPLDEDIIPPSPVPEAALTTPESVTSWLDMPVESEEEEEAGAEVYVSSASVPSGDGEGESSPPDSDFSPSPDMDYQSDSADSYLPVSHCFHGDRGLSGRLINSNGGQINSTNTVSQGKNESAFTASTLLRAKFNLISMKRNKAR